MTTSNLTASRVRELFTYNQKDGRLYRIGKPHKSRKSKSDGRYSIVFDGKFYQEHRIVWLWHHGEWPKGCIDHIDRNPLNNRIENLRDVTRSQNKQNQLASKNNKCGIKGVYWHAPFKRWRAEIGHCGKQLCIGQFKTIDEARDAYAMFAMFLHDFNPSAKAG